MIRLLLSPIRSRNGRGLSLSRTVTLLFAVTGCVVALRFPSESATVLALVGGGAVAILNRERGAPPDA